MPPSMIADADLESIALNRLVVVSVGVLRGCPVPWKCAVVSIVPGKMIRRVVLDRLRLQRQQLVGEWFVTGCLRALSLGPLVAR